MTRRRTATLLLSSAVLVPLALALPASALTPANRVEVREAARGVDVRWSAVDRASSYAVEVSKDGLYGPWRRWSTSSAATSLGIPFADHPYVASGGAYRYRVIALNAHGSATRAVSVIKAQGVTVSAVSW